MPFTQVSGPASYASWTARPIRYLAVADERGVVTTYVWACDEDDAAGWIVRRDAGTRARDDSRWMLALRDGKARGVAPTVVLGELAASPAAVPGSLTTAPSLEGLYGLADLPPRAPRWRSAHGALLGLALGDAMGHPLSSLPLDRIGEVYGAWESMELPLSGDGTVRVSDQTQLSLAVGEALAGVAVAARLPEAEARRALTTRGALPAPPWLTPPAVTTALRTHLVRWRYAPDNDRAPGRTTLNACEALASPVPWQEATAAGSKGCAAVVRGAVVGLTPYLTADQRSGIAQLQAALTHGHPTALAASDLAAHAVHLLRHGCTPADLLPELRLHASALRYTYRADWLGDLAPRADAASFTAMGWDECVAALDAAEAALGSGAEPGAAAGAGWAADAVLGGAVYAFLTTEAHPRDALRRASHTSGASAATAALAGALAGAHGGPSGWPPEWVAAVEYGARIEPLAAAWDSP